jgi:integrase
MIRKSHTLAYIKTVVRNGREYAYFDAGKVDGKRRYVRLPDRGDVRFGGVYAALLGHRSRKAEVAKAQMRLSELIALYERSPRYLKLAKNSKDNYSNYLGRFCRVLDDPAAALVNRKAVTEVLAAMIKTPSAANAMLRAVSALYQWARGATDITADPCRDIEEHEGGEHLKWPDDLLAEALASDDPRIKLAVSLLYYTAQRIGDVCNMTWGDVQDGYIHVIQEKTGKELWIRIHRDLAALLDSLPRKRDHFRGVTNMVSARSEKILGDRNRHTVRGWLQAWAKARGHKIVPHGLRKNAVIALIEAGCSTAEAGAISGQSMAIVEKYARQRDTKRLGSGAVLKWERKA